MKDIWPTDNYLKRWRGGGVKQKHEGGIIRESEIDMSPPLSYCSIFIAPFHGMDDHAEDRGTE